MRWRLRIRKVTSCWMISWRYLDDSAPGSLIRCDSRGCALGSNERRASDVTKTKLDDGERAWNTGRSSRNVDVGEGLFWIRNGGVQDGRLVEDDPNLWLDDVEERASLHRGKIAETKTWEEGFFRGRERWCNPTDAGLHNDLSASEGSTDQKCRGACSDSLTVVRTARCQVRMNKTRRLETKV